MERFHHRNFIPRSFAKAVIQDFKISKMSTEFETNQILVWLHLQASYITISLDFSVLSLREDFFSTSTQTASLTDCR